MDTPVETEIYTVSRLNQAVRQLLEGAFPLIWVEGEISNLATPASGHCYFSLKDEAAQVRSALFRNRARRLRFRPENGQRVRLRARISLYAPRGEYQLIVEHMEPAGDGELQRAFEALKARLSAEGLFAEHAKQPIPALPRRIGVITSPTGAAIRDVLSVLWRRFPALPVLIYPTAVQGHSAAAEMASAIRLANERAEVDVLLITRGGGSLEDLQAFNDEHLARAIAASSLPVVSAVGHEVDMAITDFVADERAATPSAAAERLSPDGAAIQQRLGDRSARLAGSLQRLLQRQHERLAQLSRRLDSQHPGRRLRDRSQRLDELDQRLRHAMGRRLQSRGEQLATVRGRLRAANPGRRVQEGQRRVDALQNRLGGQVREAIASRQARLAASARALEAMSPLATLQRGYAIVQTPEGQILRRAGDLQPGSAIHARLASGRLEAIVERIEDDEQPK
jgi:exodeoxyribonuclease VII large subunit